MASPRLLPTKGEGKKSFLFLGGEGIGHVAQRTGRPTGAKLSCRRVFVERGEAIARQNGYKLIE